MFCVAGGAHDGVDLVAEAALEEVAAEMAVGLAVSDDGLDGGSPAQLLFDLAVDAALLAGYPPVTAWFEGGKMVYAGSQWKQKFSKASFLAISITFLMNSPSYSEEESKEIVAAAVRQHGHVCEHPESAEPDPQDSSLGEKAWILHCENGAFRVKFTGDTGANVEPVSE